MAQDMTDTQDTLNHELIQIIVDAITRTPITTDYELLGQIAEIASRRQQPAKGTLDISTGLRY